MDAGVISFELLTVAREIELRREAKAVLSSTRRKLQCECESPWRVEGPYCGYCGKWRPTVSLVHANTTLRDAQRIRAA